MKLKVFYGLTTQSVFQGPTASASSGSLLEWRISGKIPDPLELESAFSRKSPGDSYVH